jgi:hypothetical protein
MISDVGDDERKSAMTLPHALKRIRLHLARSRDFPSGSSRHGYEFVAPLVPSIA